MQLSDIPTEAADRQLTIGRMRGSETARGRVFVVLGPPATIRLTDGPLDMTPRYQAPGRVVLPRTALESPEWHVWVYEARQNDDVLKVVRRPFLEIAFVVGRQGDQLQSATLFHEVRDAVARDTIRVDREGEVR